jgi:hypothetical protein
MPGERSIAELFTELSQSVRSLMRQELALARAELTQSVTNAKRGAILMGAGAALAWAGVLTLVAASCLGLMALGLPPAVAALIVGVILVIGGYAFLRLGSASLTPDQVAPRATVATLKDNAQLLRGQMR